MPCIRLRDEQFVRPAASSLDLGVQPTNEVLSHLRRLEKTRPVNEHLGCLDSNANLGAPCGRSCRILSLLSCQGTEPMSD